MASAFIADLHASIDLGCQIDISTIDGKTRETGIVDIDEETGWVRVYDPQSFGDDTTTTTLLLHDIVAVTLHPDIGY